MAARPARSSSSAETASFERLCQRLSGFDERLDFEWVDGFLAALAALPRPPGPAEWLPAMCGDTFERVFADPDDHAQALAVLVARLKVLRDQLDPEAQLDDPDALRLDPFIAFDEAGAGAGQPAQFRAGMHWADGFQSGVAAFPALWAVPADPEAAPLFRRAFGQVAALRMPDDDPAWHDHLAEHYPDADPDRETLVIDACMAVQDLRLFWVDFAPRTAPIRVAPRPGRNDPCPCGSGRKYKKCHGQPAPGGIQA